MGKRFVRCVHQYCYCRERRYCPFEDLDDFGYYDRVREMENLAPKMERRYAAMEQVARAGILTGISMMPILPGLCGTDGNLKATIRCTAEHGGRFVI